MVHRAYVTLVTAKRLIAVILLLGLGISAQAQDARDLWTEVVPDAAFVQADDVRPAKARAMVVDVAGLERVLYGAPVQGASHNLAVGRQLAIPLPDSTSMVFRLVESPVMPAALQARFPGIRTYIGIDEASSGSSARVSITPLGVHVMGLTPQGTFFIDPIDRNDVSRHIIYWNSDLPPSTLRHPDDGLVDINEDPVIEEGWGADDGASPGGTGSTLVIHRAAVAATSGFTELHSPQGQASVANGLAAVAALVHRANGVFERDIGVRFILVENNDRIIFANSADDPYPRRVSGEMLMLNRQVLNDAIGVEHYDIGHVVAVEGGGLAAGRVCNDLGKAMGASSDPSPSFDGRLLYVFLHELGHQYGAPHTFNSDFHPHCASSRRGEAAYEPGGGSTIMAYPGICGSHDIQATSDLYFHAASLRSMRIHLNSGVGQSCGERVQLVPSPPVPNIPGDRAIPILTPFIIRGEAVHEEEIGPLSYSWEPFNRGDPGPPPGHPNWGGTAPFFRSYSPSVTPARIFPRPDAALAGTGLLGEALPSTRQDLYFQFVVRSNLPGMGAVTPPRLVNLRSDPGAGPFRVTSQLGNDNRWHAGQSKTITWSVANTDRPGFGAEYVDIYLSLDQHTQFLDGTAIMLAQRVPNTGAHRILVPPVQTFFGRVFVQPSDGYFFGVTGAISISPDPPPGGVDEETAELSAPFPSPASRGQRVVAHLSAPRDQHARVVLYDLLGRVVRRVFEGEIQHSDVIALDIDTNQLSPGTYFLRAFGEDFQSTRAITILG